MIWRVEIDRVVYVRKLSRSTSWDKTISLEDTGTRHKKLKSNRDRTHRVMSQHPACCHDNMVKGHDPMIPIPLYMYPPLSRMNLYTFFL